MGGSGTGRGRALLAAVLAAAAAVAAPADRAPGTRSSASPAPAEVVYQGALQAGWRDDGWAPRITGEGAARVDFSGLGGWMLSHPGLKGSFGGVTFRFQAPTRLGDFLEVRLDAEGGVMFPHVEVHASDRADLPDGWSEVWIDMARLNPGGAPFDSLVIRASKQVDATPVLVDGVALTRNAPTPAPSAPPSAPPSTPKAPAKSAARAAAAPAIASAAAAPAAAPASAPPPAAAVASGSSPLAARPAPAPRPAPAVVAPARLSVDCTASTHRISPLVYGIAYDQRLDAGETHQFELGATARRWGGNSSTRYNWKLGRAWNTAQDWYFENVNYTSDPKFTWADFLEADLRRGMQSALTVPIMGWVAKDTTSYSFPVSAYGQQQSVDPTKPDAGNGVTSNGHQLTASASATSVQMSAEEIEGWVRAIRAADAKRGSRSVSMYILDNEPMLWNSTHRDVHPEPPSYEEVLERTVAYASAVRRADPDAVIAGPALWGWPAYQGSAVDAKYGWALRPDRRAHGDVPFLQWYLRKLAQHEKKTGERLLDVVDVHFYPMGDGIAGARGGTDPDTSLRRIRSTRALWDPSYKDESWINEVVRLIPRIKEWIAWEYPGRGISIGEWNFGAEGHMSGGLAVAEALGRFGEQGITSAFYWTYPPKASHAFWAFRAYRNYDGQGAHFEDWSLATRSAAPLSAFAARDKSGGHLTAVLINVDPVRGLDVDLDLVGCGTVRAKRTFQHTADTALQEVFAADGDASRRHELLPPYSITVLDLSVEPSQQKK
ncbi:MAG TPA: glycoside hydrolase family 44 protein [Anaeromyxobacteraceae bacterium]|nr:glycoside hydrolase family 44 protein [Anaeromyxobacteraceae bacterium]